MSNQFQIIDINRWWRTGGTNYPVLLQNSEHVIIQACAGRVVNEILEEQIAGVLAAGGKYETYGIPDNGDDWADFYMDLPGVMEAPKYIDWEISDGVQASVTNVTKARNKVNARSPGSVGLYTNYNSATRMGPLPWISDPDLDLWWAEYPYGWEGAYYGKYLHFDTFFRDHPWWPGKWAVKLGVGPILMQFTDKGRAQEYGANPTTNHPVYKTGIKSADLNAGLISYADYLARRFDPYAVPGDPVDPVDPGMTYVLAKLTDHDERLRIIEAKLDVPSAPPQPAPEPDPDPGDVSPGYPYVVRADKTVAWKQTGTNKLGQPILETNAFQKYGDTSLIWHKDDELRLYRPGIVADGGLKYLKCAETPAAYGTLYVKQEDVMKLD